MLDCLILSILEWLSIIDILVISNRKFLEWKVREILGRVGSEVVRLYLYGVGCYSNC